MVDTGTDYNHPDMQSNLWMNPIEKAGPGATAANGWKNGIDDDGNGQSTLCGHGYSLPACTQEHV